MTDAIVTEGFVAHFNQGLKDGLEALRLVEKKYAIRFVLLIKFNADGKLEVHVEPEGTLGS